jgi:hypothetical protein
MIKFQEKIFANCLKFGPFWPKICNFHVFGALNAIDASINGHEIDKKLFLPCMLTLLT